MRPLPQRLHGEGDTEPTNPYREQAIGNVDDDERWIEVQEF